MKKDLSRIIRGFKTGCNRSYRELVALQSEWSILSNENISDSIFRKTYN
jgi:hypothetical protein